MKEKQPKFESNIERNNIRVTYDIGHQAVLFDLFNTTLYEHSEKYRQFDHIFRSDDNDESGVYLFRENLGELYDSLDSMYFTKIRTAYPSEVDEKAWLDLQDMRLQDDLEEFEEDGYSE
jgi:hypothetical protein